MSGELLVTLVACRARKPTDIDIRGWFWGSCRQRQALMKRICARLHDPEQKKSLLVLKAIHLLEEWRDPYMALDFRKKGKTPHARRSG